jgi:L-2-hydroxycarboxylate dehydrogenase (NAD+)
MPNKSNFIDVKVDHLTNIVDQSLHAIGVPEADIEAVREVLMYAELRGNNQGLVKIPVRGVVPRADARPIEISHKLPCVAHINAHGSSGMATMVKASAEAVSLAQTYGVGVAGVHGLSTSTGAIGYYANQIAKEGMVGIVMAGSVKAVAPAGSVDPIFGTNPIAISAPTPDGPVVLDMATAAMAWYGLIQADQRGEAIEGDVAYDGDGAPTTDPAAAMKGAIRAFAGNKGAGLAFMVEVLTGPLIGNAILGDEDVARNFGDLVLAINPAAFGDSGDFMRRVETLMTKVKSARRAEDCDEILLPGERGDRQTLEARTSNTISIDKTLYEQLVALADGE